MISRNPVRCPPLTQPSLTSIKQCLYMLKHTIKMELPYKVRSCLNENHHLLDRLLQLECKYAKIRTRATKLTQQAKEANKVREQLKVQGDIQAIVEHIRKLEVEVGVKANKVKDRAKQIQEDTRHRDRLKNVNTNVEAKINEIDKQNQELLQKKQKLSQELGRTLQDKKPTAAISQLSQNLATLRHKQSQSISTLNSLSCKSSQTREQLSSEQQLSIALHKKMSQLQLQLIQRTQDKEKAMIQIRKLQELKEQAINQRYELQERLTIQRNRMEEASGRGQVLNQIRNQLQEARRVFELERDILVQELGELERDCFFEIQHGLLIANRICI